MWRPRLHNGSDAAALEADAVRARLALACAYSSADEYEAELIRTRRAAGVYGPRSHQRHAIALCATAVAAIALLLLIV